MRSFLLACALAALLGAYAQAAPDSSLDTRVAAITQELRCLVCQNQTIADSQSELAADLRRQVREMLAAGRSDAQVVQYMTARYGDFVVYRPPLTAATLLLWFGPLLVLAAGLVLLVRRVGRLPTSANLLPAERAQAELLLHGREGGP